MENETSKETTDDATAAVETAAAVETTAVDVDKADKPAPAKPVEKKPAAVQHIAKDAVVSGGDTDPVYLDKCVYMNVYARKSLTVHHVQRRLAAMGYRDAGSDKDGWYGELTKKAVAEFQHDRKLDGDGEMNAATFEAIFAGDPNVTVVL